MLQQGSLLQPGGEGTLLPLTPYRAEGDHAQGSEQPAFFLSFLSFFFFRL